MFHCSLVDMASWQQQLDSSGDSSLPKDLDSASEDEEDEAPAVLSDAASPLGKDEAALPGVLTIGLVG